MAHEQPTFKVDPETGKLVELVEQEVNLDTFEAELQTALDAAQNNINTIAEDINEKERLYTEAVHAVEAASLQLENVRKAKAVAEQAVQFSVERRSAFVQARDQQQALAGATPEGEFAETDQGDGSVPVPVTVAEAQF